ncbi:hypothetical protein [Burkholderia latens]|nr:hypothetical protein [Burkholderia latens]
MFDRYRDRRSLVPDGSPILKGRRGVLPVVWHARAAMSRAALPTA